MKKTNLEIPVYCAFDAMMETEKLKPNPRNPNEHPKSQIDLMVKIIKAHGWRAPITVSNQSGYVVRGHGRLLAAQSLGVADVPVDYQDYQSEASELADMIADNKLAELAETNGMKMEAIVKNLSDVGYPLSLTAISAEQLDELLHRSQDVDELIYEECTARPYHRTHILISFDPNLFDQIESHLESIRKIEGVEIEQSSN